MLILIGMISGMMLGELAVGNRTLGLSDEISSYSRLSANPDALVPQGEGAVSCPGCADSYGVAARMRARRDDRMSDEFRELGAVDVDVDVDPLAPDPTDDYRFGGRFPDPEPTGSRGRTAVTPAKNVAVPTPADDIPPADELSMPVEEY